MTIKVNSPQIDVLLTKSRKQVPTGNEPVNPAINLTKYLTEGSSVLTQKIINAPKGVWTIRMANWLITEYGKSVYDTIEPMDAMEIRMSRLGDPAMIMRGFVIDISLSEAMGSDGKPSRTVTIRGGDYSALLRMIQIHFMKGTAIHDLMMQISTKYMQEKFGVPYVALTAPAFVIYLVDGVINKFMQGLDNPALPDLFVAAGDADPDDLVYPMGVQANPEGTMWSHLQKHANIGPFYEVFFDDGETETTLVYRKPPYKTLEDKYVFPKTSAESFDIPPEEITAMESSRSENDVANWYYVRAPRGQCH